ncbi:MAG: aspartate 1-decarboxylase [Candidatus Micrarchaeota archaeon]
MLVEFLRGKLHRARVTEANVDYVGSITIDRDLMEAAGIYEYEKVLVVDIDNGERLETYTIAAPRGSGTICMNGAAARRIRKGDVVIVMAFCLVDIPKEKSPKPKIVIIDEKTNRIKEMYVSKGA